MHSHRSTGFTQQNKPFKGKSKGKLKRQQCGKVQRVSIKNGAGNSNSRFERHNQARQLRQNKRQDVVDKIRSRQGVEGKVPKIVGIIPLNERANAVGVKEELMKTCGAPTPKHQGSLTIHPAPGQKNAPHLTLFACAHDDTLAALDIAKVADVLLFVFAPPSDVKHTKFDAQHGVADSATDMIGYLKQQGLPKVMGVMQDLQNIPSKHRQHAKKICTRYFQEMFLTDSKPVSLESERDVKQVARHLSMPATKDLLYRDQRSYLLAEELDFCTGDNAEHGTLRVAGYLRGQRLLDVNRLVHITGVGDFQIARVEGLDQHVAKRATHKDDDEAMGDAPGGEASVPGAVVLAESSAEQRESLQELLQLDALSHDQSIITDEELAEADAEREKDRRKQLRQEFLETKGLSDYREKWDDVLKWGDGVDDIEKLKSEDDRRLEQGLEVVDERAKKRDVSIDMERDEVEFVEEFDVPPLYPGGAKARLARYRGLKSFRKSEWDPRESLPVEYGQIFQFEDFLAAKKDSMALTNEGVPPCSHVVLHILQVPTEKAKELCEQHEAGVRPVIVSSLFEHEHKVSLVHFQMKRVPEYELSVKGKDPFIFHCGFRRFPARALFSEFSLQKQDKHMVSKYFMQGEFMVVSAYARITFPPAPVFMFTDPSKAKKKRDAYLGHKTIQQAEENPPSKSQLVATGKLLEVDTDRLLIKRVVLTGYPFRVHKHKAVVRYMFHNCEDIRWFQPVELWTKLGHIGQIDEPLGTKGLFKCTFSNHLKYNDTVCMGLYKRQYPPFEMENFR